MKKPPMKSRGAAENIAHRFSVNTSVDLSDHSDQEIWWEIDSNDTALSTQLLEERSKSIITKNQSPDVPFEYSINPYRGCEHGCIYCYARPSHAYWDLSPGLDFESKIIYKSNAPELLEKAFNAKNYKVKPICIGANTDCYQPVEKQLKITRKLLQICLDYKHPVTLITKSQLVCRDIDLLSKLTELNLVSVAISVTTLDNELKRRLEPRTASPAARLKTISTLTDAKIPVTALVAPIIPGLNDHEIEAIVQAISKAGAISASYIILRLPYEVRPLFLEWLEQHYPLKKQKVINYLKSLREGEINDPSFKTRMSGKGNYAELIRQRFVVSCKKHKVETKREFELDVSSFEASTRRNQLSLF